MAEPMIAQHPPAMRVGGRRLSVTSRPKVHPAAEQTTSIPTAADDERPDYPRPAAPGEQAHDPQHIHDDHEEVPRKERKRGHGNVEHERRLQENLMRKMDQNRPSKEMGGGALGKSAVGGGGRIGQPAGKGFAA
ncbi:hypothetical protein EIP91_007233 [Steccherinum ochraceum]|uniref:Uncharacterized protein n=1 Tax=Steccherinum ochraceum TaxID=92696 RepID=A0A4R0R4F4_9APHY|nr:hypothetical protein EIP91_007233 [Steccherinum ochraceum]